ncbi:MarR family transcriptional regulator [Pseudooceanicola sp. CBS1P-1]|uniref:MarR family transcriptional regulator n=1 Tax=Pseudooceanicola albus TaxID=2692189 RepID=A0A6L7G540_9RHOB|nr:MULTISPECIES: MarR family transcriptional regulator [Pseudooceanicola]MBT9383057.1 MarR family transcriptional regulator [Pseudooceanicola endophyticus]MXN19245.1 MarR family transcriptional regulator [Pseudooceanicola albus]
MSQPDAPSARDPLSPVPTEALVCFNLYAASHAFIRLYAPYLERLGLTYPQFLVLLRLQERDGQGVGELGAALGMETSTLSPLLKRLTTAGLVQRTRSQRDERRVQVQLTEKGQGVAAEAARVPACIARDGAMRPEDYEGILAMLKDLRGQIARAAGAQAKTPPQD